MNLKPLLKQARQGQKSLVNESPETVTYRKNNTSNLPIGWAGSDYTDIDIKVRISHERSVAAENVPTPAGMSTNLQRFMTWTHEIDYLQINDIITDSKGKKWKLGAIDPLEKFGGIYGYQCPLEEANG